MNEASLWSHDTGAPQVLSADPNLSPSSYLIPPSANQGESREDGPLKASPLSRFSDAALEACLFFCLREPEYTEHMPAVLMAAALESDDNVALSVALQNAAALQQGVARALYKLLNMRLRL
ncbi:hypothetical protein SRHO_G00155540 [Serrasalmus rhombeus]